MTVIYPVIMCGGAGTRLWPLSRRSKAKQYHALTSQYTMLQETVQRMAHGGTLNIAPPSFVCAAADEQIVRAQCADVGVTPLHIILEPMGKNTAPVAAIVSLLFAGKEDDDLVLLLPADHHIADARQFWDSVAQGVKAAQNGQLITLGIQPDKPETGYGYIRQGEKIADHVYNVQAFVEKPELAKAQEYLRSGEYFWNAGIFLFSPEAMIDSFQTHAPQILNHCRKTIKNSCWQETSMVLDKDSFSKCDSMSIDYAIMEHADNVALVAPVDVGWNDIGSWTALADLKQALTPGTPNVGNIINIDCKNTYMHSDGPLIAGIGLENLIVIATGDAVLVLPKDQAQNVKQIVARLKAAKNETKY